MISKTCFGYIRVSTVRQGQTGTSLAEQRSAIAHYARTHNLYVSQEFEEQETAAKQGRPVFRKMVNAIQQGKASGIIMHKIDRGARNLKDWAEIGELIDAGIEVHFANENLDLYSRGGRLSADIQAVVAADYIRNLREEVKKGFYGRIKQGLYPMPAPLGYSNQGGGKVKAIDPIRSLLVKQAFDLYATGRYSLASLAVVMGQRELCGKSGRPLSVNGMAHVLHNLFYVGIIRIKLLDEYFLGRHEPIISKKVFDKVQELLAKRLNKMAGHGALQKTFLFRKLLICKNCGHRLVGERQKGHNYYRCHTRSCAGRTIREERVRASFWSTLKKLELNSGDTEQLGRWLDDRRQQVGTRIAEKRKELSVKLDHTRLYLGRLTDALITEAIDKPVFLERKNALITTKVALTEAIAHLEIREHQSIKQYEAAFEFMKTACLTFTYGSYERKRAVIRTIAEKLIVNQRHIAIKLCEPFEMIKVQKRA